MQLKILPEDYHLTSEVSDRNSVIVNVLCRDVVVSRNDYRTADTFTAEIDFKSFPFDPRTIRSCGVTIFMQDIGSNANDPIIPAGSSSLNPTISNAVFIGFVDEAGIEFDDSGRRVTFTGRDSTVLLIDQKYTAQSTYPASNPYPGVTGPVVQPAVGTPVQGPVYPTLPLDKAIRKLLNTFTATQKILIYSSPGTLMPVISSYDPDFGSKLAGGLNTGAGKRETYWDIIQDLAGRAGLICYMGIGQTKDGQIAPTLYLVTPKDQGLNIDQKTGLQSTQTLDDIKIIYGQNVKNLKFKRKLGRLKNFNIRVISRNQKQVIQVDIPREATQTWCNKYGITKADVIIPVMRPDGSIDTTQNRIAPAITFPYPKISSKQALVPIAQMLYEQYSLQQLEGSFTTWEMLGRGTTDKSNFNDKSSFTQYDLTQIRKGQTICVEIDPEDMSQISRFSTNDDRAKYLINRGYDPNIASLFAKTLGKMSPRFQIKSYKMHMNQESGFELTVEFYNLIDNTNRKL